ncbi:hypothetical protein DAI22_06g119901 [Oryza sativa Japonica Group]|uniref:Uncharacterized protein n=1 Tax=Oryza sativa subsp. japonica TaxID=39947 RepID=Q5VMI4_ORYSJ|nr:uncharacterized protein LOC112939326 [Oryza sativa Japonica Group]KAF2926341.1 hypothetical protein DAI22_06g119901 [Oryza sativa Japonica Group]BAD69113.1 hypothetical protein [Oryza sativa Japonica Group]BAD69341.1 hypothetical protein [Oryza sativa Japonica Group]
MDKIKDRAILLFCPSSLLDDREEHSARGPAVSLNAGSLAISPALPRRRFARRLPNAAARDHRRRNPLHNALPGRRVALSSPTFPVKAALEPEIKRSFSIQSSSFLVSKQHVLPGPRLLTRHPLSEGEEKPWFWLISSRTAITTMSSADAVRSAWFQPSGKNNSGGSSKPDVRLPVRHAARLLLAPQATARGGLPPNWGAAAAHGRHERQRRVGGGDSGERVRSR